MVLMDKSVEIDSMIVGLHDAVLESETGEFTEHSFGEFPSAHVLVFEPEIENIPDERTDACADQDEGHDLIVEQFNSHRYSFPMNILHYKR